MIEAQHAGVSTAALSAATGLHENTVRGHLDRLRHDGYVVREQQPHGGRGRPAWLWRAVITDPESPYAALAGVLAETLARTSADPVAEARRAGRTWGRDILARRDDHTGTAREDVVRVMAEQGFAPQDDGDEIRLCRCPLIEAATRHPDIVCAVHQGMIDAVLRSHGDDGEGTLVPFTAPGQCTLRLQVTR